MFSLLAVNWIWVIVFLFVRDHNCSPPKCGQLSFPRLFLGVCLCFGLQLEFKVGVLPCLLIRPNFSQTLFWNAALLRTGGLDCICPPRLPKVCQMWLRCCRHCFAFYHTWDKRWQEQHIIVRETTSAIWYWWADMLIRLNASAMMSQRICHGPTVLITDTGSVWISGLTSHIRHFTTVNFIRRRCFFFSDAGVEADLTGSVAPGGTRWSAHGRGGTTTQKLWTMPF